MLTSSLSWLVHANATRSSVPSLAAHCGNESSSCAPLEVSTCSDPKVAPPSDETLAISRPLGSSNHATPTRLPFAHTPGQPANPLHLRVVSPNVDLSHVAPPSVVRANVTAPVLAFVQTAKAFVPAAASIGQSTRPFRGDIRIASPHASAAPPSVFRRT